MVLSTMSLTAFATEGTNEPATADLTIKTVDDLKNFSQAVNAGDNFAGKTVVLANDIEVNDYWFNNGNSTDYRITKDFAGIFDGKNNSIKGLKFQNTDIAKNPNMYLFSSISGTVKNLTLDGVDADINDRDCFGFIAYTLTGTADNCCVKDVTVDVAVNANGTGYMYTSGAMFGKIVSADVTDCYANNVKYIPTGTDNSDNVGALIGVASGTAEARSRIEKCSVTNFTLDATRKTKRTGGFVGATSYTDVSNCTATCISFEIDNYGQTVGGFVGNASTSSTFTDCKVDAFKLSIADDAKYPADAGGFCSYASDATFDNCHVIGLDMDLVCNDANNGWVAGGFMGYAAGAVTVEDCSVAGDINVTGSSPNNIEVGSFMGTNNNKKVTTEDITINITTNVDGGLPENGESTEPVAKISNNPFTSLKAAVTAAQVGDTITLIEDIEIAEETVFDMKSGVTLDLNGKTFKGDDGKAVFVGTNFTIKNGTVTGFNGTDYYAITIDSQSTKALRTASNIVIEDLTVTNTGIKIKNGATVTLKDNNIKANQSKFKYAVWAFAKSNVTIESGTYFGGKNGYDVFTEGNANFIANGGTYKFKIIERNIVDETLAAVENADGTYTVKVPGIYTYEELVAAIAAANDGDTIKIDGNIDAVDNQIVINKSLTLDLGEYTISGTSEDAIVRIYSDVADKQINITINATEGGVINNGSGYAIYAGEDISDGNDAERTNLTINGGKYETAGTDCIKQIMGLCTINGGSYKSSFGRTVLNGERWYGAEFAINGGKFYGFNPACVSVWTGFDGKDYTNFYHQHDIIAEGRTAKFEDGWYTVVDGTYTEKVSTKSLCYPSLEAALWASNNMNDVANLGVITLLADDTIDLGGKTITLLDGVTIDLGGNTLTVPFQQTLFAGNDITIKNGTITTGALENYALYIMSGSFTIENVTATNGINVQAGKVILNDVNVTCPNKYYAVYASAEADVTINSGNYTTVRNANNLYADGKITVYGGTFNKMPEAKYLAEDRHIVESDSEYTVYEGFLNALGAAETGDTVYLMSDIEVAETINIDKSITLDLGDNTITSTATKNVLYSTADLTINAADGGIYSETAYVAVGQDNGVCTINGGSFKASGDTGDHANGKPVYNTLVLNNSDFYEGVTGSFVINGGKFYMFNPGCMSVNKHDHHDHDSIADGKIATLDTDGWFTVTEGEFAYEVVCDCKAPASSHQHCFATEGEAQQFIEMMGNCRFDKIVEIAE